MKLVFWAPGAIASFPTLTAPPPLRVASMSAAFSSVFVGLSALLSPGSTAVGSSPPEVVVPLEPPRWPLPEVTVEGPDAVGPLGGWLSSRRRCAAALLAAGAGGARDLSVLDDVAAVAVLVDVGGEARQGLAVLPLE